MSLRLKSPIPPGVVASNQQLVFLITAQKPGSSTARATIVVVLADGNYNFTTLLCYNIAHVLTTMIFHIFILDISGEQVLGFDRVSYEGSIENNTVNLMPIVLREGYTPEVRFTLHGGKCVRQQFMAEPKRHAREI